MVYHMHGSVIRIGLIWMTHPNLTTENGDECDFTMLSGIRRLCLRGMARNHWKDWGGWTCSCDLLRKWETKYLKLKHLVEENIHYWLYFSNQKNPSKQERQTQNHGKKWGGLLASCWAITHPNSRLSKVGRDHDMMMLSGRKCAILMVPGHHHFMVLLGTFGPWKIHYLGHISNYPL